MRTLYKIIIPALCAAAVTGCSDDDQLLGSGEGRVVINTTISTDVRVRSRAATADSLADKCILWISNPKGVVRKFTGLSTVPVAGIPLLADHYVAEAWTGDSVPASFDKKYFKGAVDFDVRGGETTTVALKCSVANSVVSVDYDERSARLLPTAKMTVGHCRGSLTFNGADQRKGYFMMPSTDTDLTWTLEATLAGGMTFTRKGTIANAKPATEYILRVRHNGTEVDVNQGGAYFTVEVDERALDVNDEVTINMAPSVEGYEFDINQPVRAESGNIGAKSVLVGTVGELKSLVVASDIFANAFAGNQVDLKNVTDDAVGAQIEALCLTLKYNYDADADRGAAMFTLNAAMLDALTDGTHTVTVNATDASGKTTARTLTFIVTDAPIVPDNAADTDIWAGHAVLSASLVKPDNVQQALILYRKAGDLAWSQAQATISGNKATATVKGLQPATGYEFTAGTDTYTSRELRTFTTEAAPQLPNASFEDWDTSVKAYLVTTPGGEMFWDTGNHGSSTLNKNVTTPVTDKVHSGTYSAKLQSQFVGIGMIGKFAAGNIFIGKYLKTLGTNGILGWGRPWTSRPTAVRGWLHFTPQAITHTSTDKAVKGDMDTGIIYAAVLDGSMSEYEEFSYPVIVNTKTQEFFSRTDPNVIAYGELVLTDATTGEAMVPFEIPLDYVRTDVKAVNIMFVSSASRWGDYFSGGPSTLYLDDIELVYE